MHPNVSPLLHPLDKISERLSILQHDDDKARYRFIVRGISGENQMRSIETPQMKAMGEFGRSWTTVLNRMRPIGRPRGYHASPSSSRSQPACSTLQGRATAAKSVSASSSVGQSARTSGAVRAVDVGARAGHRAASIRRSAGAARGELTGGGSGDGALRGRRGPQRKAHEPVARNSRE